MEAFFFNWKWERMRRGLPHRLMLSVEKQKLIDAVNHHATPTELAALFSEEEL